MQERFRIQLDKSVGEEHDYYALISDVVEYWDEEVECDAVVRIDEEDGRLEIGFTKKVKEMGGKVGPLKFDLTGIDVKSGHGRSLKQPIAKAVGIKKGNEWRPRVLDCTAGLGEDAYLLAALGCEVVSIEKHPLVYAMLSEAIKEVEEEVGGRMKLEHGDAIKSMRELEEVAKGEEFDVVYLDPMYPEKKRHKSARTKKSIWFLRQLLGHDEADSDNTVGLFEAAEKIAKRRIVVKRPNHVLPLHNEIYDKPETSHEGKSFRFDVYPKKNH